MLIWADKLDYLKSPTCHRISLFGSITSIWKTWKKNTKWLVILLLNFWYIHSLDPDDLTKLAPTGNEICVDTFSALNRSGIVPRPDEFSELTEIDINKHVLKFSIGYGESRHTKNRYEIMYNSYFKTLPLTTGFWGKEEWRQPSKWNTRFFFAFSKRDHSYIT